MSESDSLPFPQASASNVAVRFAANGMWIDLPQPPLPKSERTFVKVVIGVEIASVFASIFFIRAWRLDVHLRDEPPVPILFWYPVSDLEEVRALIRQALGHLVADS